MNTNKYIRIYEEENNRCISKLLKEIEMFHNIYNHETTLNMIRLFRVIKESSSQTKSFLADYVSLEDARLANIIREAVTL
ncbi:hypothetical protein DFO73_103441 [Cytobacillus oceanisediminis]|uniref:Uncharacterized protein n=2 Tax=Cytobacillus oceanisediminis TaxID=665099 RepID=A0A2V3A1Q6_9BACI|nr:hypothetical protein DFO73_103441 [Cytobacillus oceanisediminis]